jgi:hypothetical protein
MTDTLSVLATYLEQALDLKVERKVVVDLSVDKEFVYLDRNPTTGAWRLTITKRTLDGLQVGGRD